MVYINYIERGKLQTAEFQNVYSACHFIQVARETELATIVGWQCDYPEDNEYLNRRFYL